MNAEERTISGVKSEVKDIYTIDTDDGFQIKLYHFHNSKKCENVLLLHGVTSSAELFTLAETRNFANYLLENGKSVWVAEWRGSCNLPYNVNGPKYTLDDVALYDIPALIKCMRKINAEPIHIVAHCLGSISTLMAITAKTIDDIASISCNSIGLYPYINDLTYLKLLSIPDILETLFEMDYIPLDLNDYSDSTVVNFIHEMAENGRTECDNHFCKMLSFTFGTKDPTLFLHQNLLPETHDRLDQLFGPTPMTVYKHLLKMVSNKAVVKHQVGDLKYEALPDNYLEASRNIDIPMLLISGDKNHTWYSSMSKYYDILKANFPNVQVDYAEIEGYGHQDIFLGKNALADVYPTIGNFLTMNMKKS